LSLTKVGESVQRAKIDEYKKTKRAQKLIELIAEKQKKPFDEAWQNVAEPLLQNSETLYDALQQISLHGKEAAKSINPVWIDSVVEICENSIEVPLRELSGILSISSIAPNGLELIKKALAEAKGKSKDIELLYFGSGKFKLSVKALDFKQAEKLLREAAERATVSIEASGGKAKFEKTEAQK
jgi:translation initiation factor 2 subunit 1